MMAAVPELRMRLELIRPEQLTDADAHAWRQMAQGHPDTGSPFLGPDWVRVVSQCGGPDASRAMVLVLRDDEGPAGFMSARVGRFTAMAAGAPFCDYQGLVLRPDVAVTQRQLLEGFGAARLDLQNAFGSDRVLANALRPAAPSMVIDISDGFDAYAADRKAAGSDVIKDSAKKLRKLDREHEGVAFAAKSLDPEDLETLIRWKRGQYAQGRQTDVLAPDWSRQLLSRLVASADPDFGAILFTLRANGHLIAAHLALAGVQRLHAWIIAHDDGFARYSPGQILLHELVRWASENGYREVDLGPGDSQFKVRSANTRREVGNGFVGRPSPSTWLRAAAYGVRDTAESLPLGKFSALPGKAMRRLDVIRSL